MRNAKLTRQKELRKKNEMKMKRGVHSNISNLAIQAAIGHVMAETRE
jgi:hypothetical protein